MLIINKKSVDYMDWKLEMEVQSTMVLSEWFGVTLGVGNMRILLLGLYLQLAIIIIIIVLYMPYTPMYVASCV